MYCYFVGHNEDYDSLISVIRTDGYSFGKMSSSQPRTTLEKAYEQYCVYTPERSYNYVSIGQARHDSSREFRRVETYVEVRNGLFIFLWYSGNHLAHPPHPHLNSTVNKGKVYTRKLPVAREEARALSATLPMKVRVVGYSEH